MIKNESRWKKLKKIKVSGSWVPVGVNCVMGRNFDFSCHWCGTDVETLYVWKYYEYFLNIGVKW